MLKLAFFGVGLATSDPGGGIPQNLKRGGLGVVGTNNGRSNNFIGVGNQTAWVGRYIKSKRSFFS